MDFTLPIPSLKNMAIFSIVRTLWLSSVILGKSKSGFDFHSLKKRNYDVMKNVEKINLPDTIKEDVLSLTQPIGFQIYEWLKDHLDTNLLDTEVTRQSIQSLSLEIGVIIINMRSCVSLTEMTLPYPSLQNFSIIELAKSLWSTKSVLKEVIKFCEIFDQERFNDIATMIVTNSKILKIPSLLKEVLISLLQLVNSGLSIWFMDPCNSNLFDFEVTYPSLNHLCWTAFGTIDRRKTAQKLVKLGLPTELSKRYKLACLYSLEDLDLLWNQLEMADFYQKDLSTIRLRESFETYFWSCNNENDLARLDEVVEAGHTVNEYMLLVVTRKVKCLSVFSSFWDGLTTEEKQSNLVGVAQTASQYKSAEIVLFLISEMTPQVAEEFLRNNVHHILLTFLQWPYHNIFLSIFKLTSTYLSGLGYHKILNEILTRVEFNYEDILSSLWMSSSEFHKSFVVENDDKVLNMFRELIDKNYKEPLKLIWLSVDRNERDLKFVRISHSLIKEQNWYLLNHLLPLCLIGDFAIPKFKRYMNDYAKLRTDDYENWNKTDRLTLLEYLYDHFKE